MYTHVHTQIYIDVACVRPSDQPVFDYHAARARIAQGMVRLTEVRAAFGAGLMSRLDGGGPWAVAMVDTVLTDGMFVSKDALARFADIRSLEEEARAAASTAGRERREAGALLHQLRGVAVHFLDLSRKNMALLDLMLLRDERRGERLLGAPALAEKVAGFLHALVWELCGPHRGNLLVTDAEAYGFSPRRMVAQVARLLALVAGQPHVRQALPLQTSSDTYVRLARVASDKCGVGVAVQEKLGMLLRLDAAPEQLPALGDHVRQGAPELAVLSGGEGGGDGGLEGGGEGGGEGGEDRGEAGEPHIGFSGGAASRRQDPSRLISRPLGG